MLKPGKLPPLGPLRAFETAARLGNFSRAAEELFMTAGAVSQQIRQLELHFEKPLFHRQARGVRLTDEGAALFRVVHEALVRIGDVAADIKQSQHQITVGCIPSIATHWLIPNLQDLNDSTPTLETRVVYAHAAERLSESDCDVVITAGKDPSPDVLSEKLFSRVNLPVTSRHYLATHGPLDTTEAIYNAKLLHDESKEHWREWFEKVGIANPDVDHGNVFQDFNLLGSALLAGHGVALCPVKVFHRQIADGDLVVLSDTGVMDDRGYYISRGKEAGGEVQTFCEWFKDICKVAI